MSAPRGAAWWDARYGEAPSLWGQGPNRFVAEAFEGVRPWGNRRALDVACGEGRNAVWLAEQGWDASGVDFSLVALERAKGMARERGVEVQWIVGDLLRWEPEGPYALIVVAYLQVSRGVLSEVLARLAGALEPGGELFAIGHARRNLEHGVGGPQDPAVLWEPSELRDDLVAAGLEVEACAEVERPVEGKGVALDLRARARR